MIFLTDYSVLHRLRRGLVERIDENIAAFAVACVFVLPLIITQALLSARDDNMYRNNRRGDSIGATEAIIPIFILLGLFIFIAVLFAIRAPNQTQVTEIFK